MFSPLGELTDVRLVMKPGGRLSKGYGYVEFADAAVVQVNFMRVFRFF